MFWIVSISIVGIFIFFSMKGNSKPSSASPSSNNSPVPITDGDTWEGWFIGEATDPKPINVRLAIKYEDGRGILTERIINVFEFDNADNPTGLIIAKCELRNANRTFRYDRIKECIDLETGEYIEQLPTYLKKKYKDSPHHSVDAFAETHTDPLECLIFIAKSDGRFMSAERKIIIDFCKKHMSDNRVTDETLEKLLKESRNVSVHAYRMIVGRIAKMDQLLKDDIIEAANQIVGTQKTVHPSEKEAVDYIAKRFSN